MYTKRRALFAASVLVALGCGKTNPGIVTAPVSGVVTLDGKPLEGASVNFQNKNPDGKSANGYTDSEGHYTLATYVSAQEYPRGAQPGDYRVTITKMEQPAGSPSPQEMQNMKGDEAAAMMQKMMGGQQTSEMAAKGRPGGAGNAPPGLATMEAKSLVPEKYTKGATSGFAVTVTTGEAQTFDFPLKSQ